MSFVSILVVIMAFPLLFILPVPTVFPSLSNISMSPLVKVSPVSLSVTVTFTVTFLIDELVIVAIVCDSFGVTLIVLLVLEEA